VKFHGLDPFYVQENDRGPWHVETPGDPETMLCGLTISVDANAKVQKRWGLKPCLWCKRELELALSSGELRSRLQATTTAGSTSTTLSPGSTTGTGRGT
jgi:hypothetical protein